MTYPGQSRLSDCLTIQPSTVEGRGLFAARAIEAGEVLIVYGGTAASDAEIEKLRPHSSMAVAEGVNLIRPDEDSGQFLNHSCDPNAWMLNAVTLVARRRIGAGEEITMDYALVSAQAGWSMPCSCGSNLCRGVVTGADWQRPELQQRYAGYFSPFLNERIRQL